jgi:hypothetical protein
LKTWFKGLLNISFLMLMVGLGLHGQPTARQPANPKFEDYPIVKKYSGRPGKVDLGSDPRAKEFRTMLRRGIHKGANFAGEFTVVEWGCGTQCQTYGILNTRTGRVVGWREVNYCGAQFRIDSRLLVFNPHPDQHSVLQCDPEYFVMENGRLKPLPLDKE